MKVIRPVKHKWSTIDCNKNNSRCSCVHIPFIKYIFWDPTTFFEKFHSCTNMATYISHQLRILKYQTIISQYLYNQSSDPKEIDVNYEIYTDFKYLNIRIGKTFGFLMMLAKVSSAQWWK